MQYAPMAAAANPIPATMLLLNNSLHKYFSSDVNLLQLVGGNLIMVALHLGNDISCVLFAGHLSVCCNA